MTFPKVKSADYDKVMLNEVRAGHNVVGVFYGHPGVLVTSSQRAIAIARDEGYSAKMVSGISAVDTLWADLGVDPSRSGCVSYHFTGGRVILSPTNTYHTSGAIRGHRFAPEDTIIAHLKRRDHFPGWIRWCH